jgi:hypothetical protein
MKKQIRRKNLVRLYIMLAVLIGFAVQPTTAYNPKEPLAIFVSGGFWHFINYDGEEMFSPKVLVDYGGFSDGLFRVLMNFNGKNRWVFLDTLGEIKIIPDGQEVMMYSEGLALAAVSNNDTTYDYLFGFVDKTGKVVLPYKYIDASYFANGLAWARTMDTKGYIDKTGKYVFTNDTLIGNAFCEGMAVVNNLNYKMGFIDTTGKIAIPLKFDEVTPFSEGRAFFHNNGWGGYLDKKGNVVVAPQFDDGKPFSEGHAFIGNFWKEKMILWGIIDTVGTLVVKHRYESVRRFSEGIAAVARERSWGFIDYEGNYLIPSQFSSAGSFKNGLAWASVPFKKYGFIDKKGEYIIEIPKPEKVFDIRFGEQVY